MLRKGVIDTKSRENLLVKRLCRISSCGGKLRSLLAEVKEHNICRAEEINEATFGNSRNCQSVPRFY
jgi:hypothetical protein